MSQQLSLGVLSKAPVHWVLVGALPAWDPDSPFLTTPLCVRVLLLFYHGIKPTLHLASEPQPLLLLHGQEG